MPPFPPSWAFQCLSWHVPCSALPCLIALLPLSAFRTLILYSVLPAIHRPSPCRQVFVLVYFGPVAVAGTHYVQSLDWSSDAVLIGLASGLISTAILVVNNLRDRIPDERVGKNTLAVRFGVTFARWEYTLCILGAASIAAFYSLQRPCLVLTSFAFLRSLPIIKAMWTDSGRDLDPNLGKTAQVLVLFSILFSIGWRLH